MSTTTKVYQMTADEFLAATRSVRMSAAIHDACKAICTTRTTWAAACRKHKVTKSGVLKALRRAKLR